MRLLFLLINFLFHTIVILILNLTFIKKIFFKGNKNLFIFVSLLKLLLVVRVITSALYLQFPVAALNQHMLDRCPTPPCRKSAGAAV